MIKPAAHVSSLQSNKRIFPQDSRIFIAGHSGMVGSAILRRLQRENYLNIVTRTHAELDLTDQGAVRDFFRNEKIDAAILAAARVGGIHANSTYSAEFIYENIMIQANVIHEAFQAGVERLLFLGSSCIYPKFANQPMREEELLTGLLEPTNEPYAIAKICGIKICESYNRQYGTHYRSVMPTNLYGPNDNYDLERSHVLPAMIRKFHLAKLALHDDWKRIHQDEVQFGLIPEDIRAGLRALAQSHSGLSPAVRLWGSGRPKREFLHVDDLASACLFIMNLSDETYDNICVTASDLSRQRANTGASAPAIPEASDFLRVSHINIGSGKDIFINQLAEMVREVVGFEGGVKWDASKPDGTPRKLLDVSRLRQLGWKSEIRLLDGIKSTYEWYLAQAKAE
jgi:GDP-L-fucose synthase